MLGALASWRESISGMVNAPCWPHATHTTVLKEMRQRFQQLKAEAK